MNARSLLRQITPPLLYDLARKLRQRNSSSWHRESVGGLWDQLGKLQFDFLVAQGLKPEHKFLDIGCGSLRGGNHFINYLKPGHYFGMDNHEARLKAGLKHELTQSLVQDKQPTLQLNEDFNFSIFERKFDYALAQSVFPHLPLNAIIRCIINIDKALAHNGKFYATFFDNPHGKAYLEPIHRQPGEPQTYMDKNPFHYDVATFEWICQSTGLKVHYCGEWGHPRGQKILLFTKVA